jgi:hypothetical protein
MVIVKLKVAGHPLFIVRADTIDSAKMIYNAQQRILEYQQRTPVKYEVCTLLCPECDGELQIGPVSPRCHSCDRAGQ